MHYELCIMNYEFVRDVLKAFQGLVAQRCYLFYGVACGECYGIYPRRHAGLQPAVGILKDDAAVKGRL